MRLAAILAVLAVWAILAAPPAAAHVEVLGSTPTDGTRLTEPPSAVTIRLSENIGIQKNAMRVVDVHGDPVSEGPVTQGETAEQMTIRLKPDLPDGTYLVHYAFVSADSHPVRGGFAFVVGNGPLMNAGGAVSSADGTDTAVDILTRVVRWLGYAGVALAGGVFFLLYFRPTDDKRAHGVARAGCVLIAGSAVFALGMEGAYVTGAGLSRVFAPDLLANTLDTAYGKLLILRIVAAGVLLYASRRAATSFGYQNTAIVSGFLILLTSSAAGHAITTQIMFLSLVGDLAHYGAMALWLGGVVQLALCARHEDLPQAMARFSPVAKICVAIIVISGALLSAAYVGSVSALFTTAYGLLLLAKLAGFVVLLALADRCRRAVDARSTGTTLVRVRTALVAEVAIAAVVLGIAAAVATIGTPG
ncbi:copper resistance CopC/CopD family protein [Actinokineospora diospyrosa]|uniref:Copper transport protein n=1 Tax=Actinokineospora diospyrosa TaxID=103728 RepID=A0ABT1IN77_9PSEU|nr:copper resistance protein CopC [Actinokineospora diospyrosa]MCP2274112.1 copper transport protein [Actinokineospora diospyrosa]